MWDRPGMNTYSCPLCRSSSVRWALHEQVGITPEVVDVWDNELMMGTDRALARPDTTTSNTRYWMHENERLATSVAWNVWHGTRPRKIDVEMANMRQARRRRNKSLRDLVSKADGVEGLDPEDDGNP